MAAPGGEQDIKDFSAILGGVFEGLDTQDARRAGDAFSVWRRVLLGIRSGANPNEGANLAAHSRIIDLKNGVLLVEADHPGWMELLQLRRQFILKGLSMYAPGMGVQTLAFRLAGKRGEVSGSPYDAQEVRGLAEQRLAREEAALAARGASAGSAARRAGGGPDLAPGEMAPELAAALSALRRDMGA